MVFIFDPDERPRNEVFAGHPVVDNEVFHVLHFALNTNYNLF